MTLKKCILSIGLLVAFAFNAPGVQAMTAQEIQALIAQLQAQIAELNRQLAEIPGQEEQWCHTFSTNLRIGDSNDEVFALQTALDKEGFSVVDLSENGSGQSKFGEQTASAVVGFQEKYRSEVLAPFRLTRGTGFVGPSTRAKLNRLYGCSAVAPVPTPLPTPIPTPVTPSITVLSPNGGERWARGSTQTVVWEGTRYQKGYVASFVLIDSTEVNIHGVTVASIGSESGRNIATLSISPYLPLGSYRLQMTMVVDGIRSYDNSDGYVNIVEASNTAPSISITYPTSGQTLQKGTTSYVNVRFSPSVPLGGFVVNLIRSDTETMVAHLRTCGTVSDYTKNDVIPPNVIWQWKVGYDAEGKEIPSGSYKILAYDCGDKLDSVWTGSVAIAKSNVFSIVSSTSMTPAPEMVYPVNGQTLSHGNSTYFFKVKPVSGASGYLFGFFQNGIMVYENWRDDRRLSRNGEFSILPDNPFYSKLQEGPVEVWVRAYVNNQWSEARVITITLAKDRISSSVSLSTRGSTTRTFSLGPQEAYRPGTSFVAMTGQITIDQDLSGLYVARPKIAIGNEASDNFLEILEPTFLLYLRSVSGGPSVSYRLVDSGERQRISGYKIFTTEKPISAGILRPGTYFVDLEVTARSEEELRKKFAENAEVNFSFSAISVEGIGNKKGQEISLMSSGAIRSYNWMLKLPSASATVPSESVVIDAPSETVFVETLIAPKSSEDKSGGTYSWNWRIKNTSQSDLEMVYTIEPSTGLGSGAIVLEVEGEPKTGTTPYYSLGTPVSLGKGKSHSFLASLSLSRDVKPEQIVFKVQARVKNEILPSITVLSPNGGEEWVRGKTYVISWQSQGIDRVDIVLGNRSTSAYRRTIAANILNTGSYQWTVDTGSYDPIFDYTLGVEESGGLGVGDASDKNFSIVRSAGRDVDGDGVID